MSITLKRSLELQSTRHGRLVQCVAALRALLSPSMDLDALMDSAPPVDTPSASDLQDELTELTYKNMELAAVLDDALALLRPLTQPSTAAPATPNSTAASSDNHLTMTPTSKSLSSSRSGSLHPQSMGSVSAAHATVSPPSHAAPDAAGPPKSLFSGGESSAAPLSSADEDELHPSPAGLRRSLSSTTRFLGREGLDQALTAGLVRVCRKMSNRLFPQTVGPELTVRLSQPGFVLDAFCLYSALDGTGSGREPTVPGSLTSGYLVLMEDSIEFVPVADEVERQPARLCWPGDAVRLPFSSLQRLTIRNFPGTAHGRPMDASWLAVEIELGESAGSGDEQQLHVFWGFDDAAKVCRIVREQAVQCLKMPSSRSESRRLGKPRRRKPSPASSMSARRLSLSENVFDDVDIDLDAYAEACMQAPGPKQRAAFARLERMEEELSRAERKFHNVLQPWTGSWRVIKREPAEPNCPGFELQILEASGSGGSSNEPATFKLMFEVLAPPPVAFLGYSLLNRIQWDPILDASSRVVEKIDERTCVQFIRTMASFGSIVKARSYIVLRRWSYNAQDKSIYEVFAGVEAYERLPDDGKSVRGLIHSGSGVRYHAVNPGAPVHEQRTRITLVSKIDPRGNFTSSIARSAVQGALLPVPAALDSFLKSNRAALFSRLGGGT